MYTGKAADFLGKNGILAGDSIVVHFKGISKEGMLMPKDKFSSPDTLTLKLGNGYNIGIDCDGITKIEKTSGAKHDQPSSKKSHKLSHPGKGKPVVSIISTGGTIASRIDYRTGGVYALSEASDILSNIPELSKFAAIRCSTPFLRMSEDLSPSDWVEIAKAVHKELNSDASGVIVTHGTDTLHYTASALAFMLKDVKKPVIIVGSQRSSDRASSDAAMNIICAARVALSDMAEVGVCTHGETSDSFCFFIRATKARKMHTSRRDAFRPINDLPLAKVYPNGRIEKIKDDIKEREEGVTSLEAAAETKTALLKTYPGADPDIIDFLIREKGFRGFVIEGTGLGHVPTNCKNSWTETIKKYSGRIPFVITSQTIYGRVNPDVYSNLRELYYVSAAIPGEDMTAETAYVKLCWVLAKTSDMKEIKRLMLENIAGEITQKTSPDAFLY